MSSNQEIEAVVASLRARIANLRAQLNSDASLPSHSTPQEKEPPLEPPVEDPAEVRNQELKDLKAKLLGKKAIREEGNS